MISHGWDLSPSEAIELQRALSVEVSLAALPESFQPLFIVGVDTSSEWHAKDLFAAVVVLSYPSLEIVEVHSQHFEPQFAYIPGLLSFRETPALLPLFERIKSPIDLVVVDGNGTIHPRKFGLACHLGLALDIPTFGIAKSRLLGEFELPAAEQGSTTFLTDVSEVLGKLVRTRTNVAPVFVSPGHLISLDDAVEWTLKLSPKRRLSEPVLAAHHAANEARKLGKQT